MIMTCPYNKENKVFGKTLVELAEKDSRVAVFDADLGRATETKEFKTRFPDRHFNMASPRPTWLALPPDTPEVEV